MYKTIYIYQTVDELNFRKQFGFILFLQITVRLFFNINSIFLIFSWRLLVPARTLMNAKKKKFYYERENENCNLFGKISQITYLDKANAVIHIGTYNDLYTLEEYGSCSAIIIQRSFANCN